MTLVQVGAPVFFVVRGSGLEQGGGEGVVRAERQWKPCNLSEPEDLKKLCTRRGCRRDSLGKKPPTREDVVSLHTDDEL